MQNFNYKRNNIEATVELH